MLYHTPAAQLFNPTSSPLRTVPQLLQYMCYYDGAFRLPLAVALC